ncbi:hypothetical protein GH714_006325 [Hevea brasiliensis]|uniref:Reverse transcriptase zinc-binding domain-containing protein n=1 Tax=Hevea brasiliensis TaxID=3981 RepID=A0A6A6MZ26_HEVBR|nr:hypothetical protein GH714_006325 [Hevea brasiliensis]
MTDDGLSWNMEIIRNLFNDRDVALIGQIPLLQTGRDDARFWIHDCKGIFTIKSAYKWLMGDFNASSPRESRHVDVDTSCSMRGLEIEHWRHVFVIGCLARDCWRTVLPQVLQLSSLSILSQNRAVEWLDEIFRALVVEDLMVFCVTLWAIWFARNDKLWNRRSPPVGMLKCNVDAAVFAGVGKIGTGWVVRNHEGKVLNACQYALELLSDASFLASKPATTPMDGTLKLQQSQEDAIPVNNASENNKDGHYLMMELSLKYGGQIDNYVPCRICYKFSHNKRYDDEYKKRKLLADDDEEGHQSQKKTQSYYSNVVVQGQSVATPWVLSSLLHI